MATTSLHVSPEATTFPAHGVAGGIQRALAVARRPDSRPSETGRLLELRGRHLGSGPGGERRVRSGPAQGVARPQSRLLRLHGRGPSEPPERAAGSRARRSPHGASLSGDSSRAPIPILPLQRAMAKPTHP
jgi:hypothetical protein